jgi:hypothetical protein
MQQEAAERVGEDGALLRMLTYADVCSKKRRSEWEKKAHYYAPEDAESLLPEGDDIGPVSHLSRITSRITSAYWYMCLLPEGRDIGPVGSADLSLTSTKVQLLFQYNSTNTDDYSARESTRQRPKTALFLPLYVCPRTIYATRSLRPHTLVAQGLTN